MSFGVAKAKIASGTKDAIKWRHCHLGIRYCLLSAGPEQENSINAGFQRLY